MASTINEGLELVVTQLKEYIDNKFESFNQDITTEVQNLINDQIEELNTKVQNNLNNMTYNFNENQKMYDSLNNVLTSQISTKIDNNQADTIIANKINNLNLGSTYLTSSSLNDYLKTDDLNTKLQTSLASYALKSDLAKYYQEIRDFQNTLNNIETISKNLSDLENINTYYFGDVNEKYIEYVSVYQSSKTYIKNDFCFYNGYIYCSNKDGNTGNTPSLTSTEWTKMSENIESLSSEAPPSSYDSKKNYNVGDYCIYDNGTTNVVYRCIQSGAGKISTAGCWNQIQDYKYIIYFYKADSVAGLKNAIDNIVNNKYPSKSEFDELQIKVNNDCIKTSQSNGDNSINFSIAGTPSISISSSIKDNTTIRSTGITTPKICSNDIDIRNNNLMSGSLLVRNKNYNLEPEEYTLTLEPPFKAYTYTSSLTNHTTQSLGVIATRVGNHVSIVGRICVDPSKCDESGTICNLTKVADLPDNLGQPAAHTFRMNAVHSPSASKNGYRMARVYVNDFGSLKIDWIKDQSGKSYVFKKESCEKIWIDVSIDYDISEPGGSSTSLIDRKTTG